MDRSFNQLRPRLCRMTWRTTCILALVLIGSLQPMEASLPDGTLTAAEYGARLDGLITETGRSDLTSEQATDMLRNLPSHWRVSVENQKFEIPTDWLRDDLLDYGNHADPEILANDHAKLLSLRADLNAYQKNPPDNSALHTRLTDILSRREFHSIHGPTWLDRLKQGVFLWMLDLLRRLFRSSSIPTIGGYFIYVLVGLAVLGLAYWIYRSIRADADTRRFIPETLIVSAKEWTVWMAEARQAASQGNWQDAIHLAYWSGISFLEAQGAWRPDRARTPREYLRLMPESSEKHPTLIALTHSFELVWYGNREADAQAFSRTLQELEKLGCHPS
jgi:Domain of unknown function (DUF4129)